MVTKFLLAKTNPDKIKIHTAKYYEKHKAECNVKNMKRMAAKLNAIPKWLTSEDWWLIKEIYHLSNHRSKITGIRWSVDHIVPLQGKLVSGLHTPWNLQVIPSSINSAKHNSFEVS